VTKVCKERRTAIVLVSPLAAHQLQAHKVVTSKEMLLKALHIC
jgi:hypothetical protein